MHSVCQVPLKLDEFICLLHCRLCNVTTAHMYITMTMQGYLTHTVHAHNPPITLGHGCRGVGKMSNEQEKTAENEDLVPKTKATSVLWDYVAGLKKKTQCQFFPISCSPRPDQLNQPQIITLPPQACLVGTRHDGCITSDHMTLFHCSRAQS